VGSGHLKSEFKTLGADYEERGKVTDEYMRALAAVWKHDVGYFDGEFVSFRDMMVWPVRCRSHARRSGWAATRTRP